MSSTMRAASLPRRSSASRHSVRTSSTRGRPMMTMAEGQNQLSFHTSNTGVGPLESPHLLAVVARECSRLRHRERRRNALSHPIRHVYAVTALRALHLEREVDGVTPQVVSQVRLADEAAARIPHINSRAEVEVRAVLHTESLDDAVQLEGELEHAAGVVDARHRETAACQVALRGRSHMLDTDAVGRLVEAAHQLVEQLEGVLRVEVCAELLEPH